MSWIKSLVDAGCDWAALPGYSSGASSFGYFPTPQYGRSSTGQTVSRDTMLKLSAWFGSHRILSGQFSLCALKLMRRLPNGGKEVARKKWLHNIFTRSPNKFQDPMVYLSQSFSSKFFNGNSYSYIQFSDAGLQAGLIPLDSSKVEPVQDKRTFEIHYEYRNPLKNNEVEIIPPEKMLHWIGPTVNGVTGLSLISYAANQIGIMTKRQDHQENVLENGARPSGQYTVPGKLQKPEFAELVSKIRKQYQGPANAGNIIVLDNGAKFEQTSMSNQDMQYIEDKRMDIGDVSRFTGVPKILLFEDEDAGIHSMYEAGKLFYRFGLNDHLTSFEKVATRKLVPSTMQEEYFFEFDRSDFEKMDLDKTAQWVKDMRYAGCMTANEGRSVFNMTRKEEEHADGLLRPENMAPADAPYQAKNPQPENKAAEDASNKGAKTDKKDDKKVKNSLQNAFLDVFSDAFSRIYSKSGLKYSSIAKKHGSEEHERLMLEFFKEQRDNYTSTVKPIVTGLIKAHKEMTPSLELAADRITSSLVDHLIDSMSSQAVSLGYISAAALDVPLVVGKVVEKVEEIL